MRVLIILLFLLTAGSAFAGAPRKYHKVKKAPGSPQYKMKPGKRTAGKHWLHL